jgi:hypothetical protein
MKLSLSGVGLVILHPRKSFSLGSHRGQSTLGLWRLMDSESGVRKKRRGQGVLRRDPREGIPSLRQAVWRQVKKVLRRRG